jgi:very-short-patch-repair endonuclease
MRNIVRGADAVVAEIAAGQHGVIHVGQLLAAGLSRAGVSRRVGAGRLHPIHHGVYAVGHTGLGNRGRWKAATLALGSRAVLSHGSAAELWGMLPESRRVPQVILPGAGARPRRGGIDAHRSVMLARREATIRDGIPVTTPARTLADLRRTAPAALVRKARREAEYLRLPLAAGERGDGTASGLEHAFLSLCRDHRLPEPEVNVGVDPYTVDFLWRPQRLVVELDGYRAHSGWQAFQDDHVRDTRLAARGYYVQRFSDWQVDSEPDAVIRTLRTLIDRLTPARAV